MKYMLRIIAVLLCFLLAGQLLAQIEEEEAHEIILMGKVTHAEYGSPIKNYEVFIISDSIESGVMDYFNTVRTDQEGFYFDTITTFLDAGTLVVYTFDFYNNKQENSVHFRFMNSNNDNIFISNFSVDLPFQEPTLQAQFTFEQIENQNKYHFAFFDQTNNDHIISWLWDFGDNTISQEQNPKHVYTLPGIYKVELTIEAIVYEHVEFNTISQYLYIPANVYYHMGGHCFTNDFPIDNGLAYLYYYSELENMKPIDTARIDTLGYYYFYQVQEGKYCIKAQPSKVSSFYGEMFPTYYGDEMFWEDAVLINHDHTDWEYDIELIEALGTNSGDGLIAGQVVSNESFMSIGEKQLEGVDVYLIDANENPLTSRYTDEEGHFDFDDLALDTYWMCQEMTGVPRTKVMIQLDEKQPEVTDIQIDLTTGDIILDVSTNPWFRETGDPYPNPAGREVFLNVEMHSPAETDLELIDMQGRLIKQSRFILQQGVNRIRLELEGIDNGYYLVRLRTGGTSVEKQLVISR